MHPKAILEKGELSDEMADLQAINLHLQKRLEREWLDAVTAVEAARWLDKAGLLPDRKNGLPLRNLLRAGRIAGQVQQPNQRHGSWYIRRIAESDDQNEVNQARERMRMYLPIDRDKLHAGWPLPRGAPTFWESLGRAVAAFGYLETVLVSARHSLTGPPADLGELDANGFEALLKWNAKRESVRTDSLHALACRLDGLLGANEWVPCAVRDDLDKRLEELRPWRNALCHGTWLGFDANGSGRLMHFHRVHFFETVKNKQVARFQPTTVSLKELADLLSRIADTTLRVVEACSVAGVHSAQVAALPRIFRRWELINDQV